MNKKQIMLSQAGVPMEELDAGVRTLAASDPELQRVLEAQARVAALMKLKNYERPDPAMEGRVLHRVGLRIRNGEHLRKDSRLDLMPDWVRMMAVVVVMLGLSVLTHREMLETPEEDNAIQTAAQQSAPFSVSDLSGSPQGSSADALSDPFGPVTIGMDNDPSPYLLTPEFANQLEMSFMELGLDFTNRTENPQTLPVSFTPLR